MLLAKFPFLIVILLGIVFVPVGCGTKDPVLQSKSSDSRPEDPDKPSTTQELNRWYAEPAPGDNAFPLLAQAFDAMQVKGSFASSVPGLGTVKWNFGTEPLSAEMQAAMGSFLAANKAALEHLHAAATKESFRSPVDLRQGFKAQLPHLIGIRDAAHLLRVSATYHAEEGNSAEAAHAVATMARLGSLVAQEPLNISYLVVCATRGMTARTVERILSRTSFTADQLSRLRESLREAEQPNGLYNAYVGERAIYLDLFRMPAEERDAQLKAFDQGTRTPLSRRAIPHKEAAWKADEAYFTRVMNKLIEAAEAPFPEARSRSADLDREANTGAHYLSQRILPSASGILARHLSSIAELRCGQAALAIAQHHARNGDLPAKVADLAPEIRDSYPTDPADDTPLIYVREGSQSFAIHSMIELNSKRITHSVKLPESI